MPESPTFIEIDANSGLPIYRQIVDQVVAMVAGGVIKEGDLLPSVRQVAADAAVNPMTVSKAYSRLEADGIVRRVRGKGMKVLPRPFNGSIDVRKEKFRESIKSALHRARLMGLNEEQIRDVISSLLKNGLL